MKAAGRSFLPRESRLQFPESLPSARSRRQDPSIAHLLTTLADDLIVCTGGSMRRALADFSKADPSVNFLCALRIFSRSCGAWGCRSTPTRSVTCRRHSHSQRTAAAAACSSTPDPAKRVHAHAPTQSIDWFPGDRAYALRRFRSRLGEHRLPGVRLCAEAAL